MERQEQRTVRFRVASAHSGRVLTEVFKDDRVRSGPPKEPPASGPGVTPPAPAWPCSEANSHLNGLGGAGPDESGTEPDQLLLFASAKRVHICSHNGTVRGVRNKVSAGQVLFNSLSAPLRQHRRRPREKDEVPVLRDV